MTGEKLHYYLISFVYVNSEKFGAAQLTVGYPDERVSAERIRLAREALVIPEDSVPVAVSYLGFMTREESSE